MMTAIFTTIQKACIVAKKELKMYFNGPTAYIAAIVFLLLWEFLFFRNAFLVGEASLRILFAFLPWLFLFLIPALTMGSVSQEKSEGTLEFLLTHSLRDREVIAGKFFAALVFVALTLLFIFPLAASFGFFSNLDWGVVWGQYFASTLLASQFIALGIFVSSLFANTIPALLVSGMFSFFLIIAGLEIVTASVPLFFAPFFERLSALSHFESMARGVIDLRDLWYFFSATFIFLSLAYLQLLKRRYGNNKALYRSHVLGIALFIGIAVLMNVVGSRIPGRIDLTQDQLYTVTQTTKKTLSALKDVVTITLFASDELPAQLQPALRDTKDMLRDYRILGKGNLSVVIKNPSNNPRVSQEAEALGIRQAQFNVIGQEEFQVKQGYFGIAVSYAEASETIPFIEDTRDLEYQLTSMIKQLTTVEKKKIGFLTGHGEKDIASDYRAFSQELQKQFEIETITLAQEKENANASRAIKPIPPNTAALVIAGPIEKIGSVARSAITAYLDKGGSVLFLIDGITVQPQFFSASPNKESFSDFLKKYGVEIKPTVLYDLRSNETVSFGGGFINFLVPYPFWVRALASKDNAVTQRLESIVVPWPSSIAIDEALGKEKGFVVSPLLRTTHSGGEQSKNFSLDPQKPLPKENLGEHTIAVGIARDDEESNERTSRMIVVGDSDFLTDQFAQQSPENSAFGMEALSWLTRQDSLAGIQVKQKVERKLLFKNQTQAMFVKYGNMAFALLLPLGVGLFFLIRRRVLRKHIYGQKDV